MLHGLARITVAPVSLLLSVFTGAALAQDAALNERLEALCAKLDQKREEYHVPGMAIAIVKDDKVILARGFGVRDLDAKIPADENTLFAIGSSTKAITSALCAMMVDESKMRWDDPVRSHFNLFTLSDVTARDATIRDVLSHRTGVARTDILWYGGTASIEQVYAALGRATLIDPFREDFNYNNNTYAAAGFAAAHAAGTDWPTLVKARVFTPLGMASSNTSVKECAGAPNLALGYAWDDEARSYKRKPMRDLTLAAPAGSINSTALDMARWVRLQLGRGTFEGKELISREAIDEMWTKQIGVAPSVAYGMGWMLRDWNGRRVVEHGGNIDGFAAQVGLLPDEHAGFVLLTNVSATPLQSVSQGMVWDALVPPATPAEEGAIAPDRLAEYIGEYRFALQGSDVKVLVKDGKLCVDVPGQMVYELRWPDESGKWYFALTNTIATGFVRDDKGRITSMTMYQAGLEMDLPRKGVEVPPPPYTDAELQRFTGEYHFEYLGRSEDWRVFVREGRLACEVPKQFTFTLKWPDEQGTWVFQELKELTCQFEKDGAGAIVAINAHQRGMDFHLPRKGGANNPDAPLPTLDDLMARRAAVAARVGAAGIVRMTGTVDMPRQGVSGTVSTTLEGSRFRNQVEFPPFGFIRQSYDGTRVLADTLGEEYQELKGAKREETIRQAPGTFWADLRTYYDTAEVTGEEMVDGARAIVVNAAKGDGKTRARFLINPENGLPWREVTTTTVEGLGSVPITITYGDYREQSGVTAPFKIEFKSDITGGLEIQYETVEVGLADAPGLFEIDRAK